MEIGIINKELQRIEAEEGKEALSDKIFEIVEVFAINLPTMVYIDLLDVIVKILGCRKMFAESHDNLKIIRSALGDIKNFENLDTLDELDELVED